MRELRTFLVCSLVSLTAAGAHRASEYHRDLPRGGETRAQLHISAGIERVVVAKADSGTLAQLDASFDSDDDLSAQFRAHASGSTAIVDVDLSEADDDAGASRSPRHPPLPESNCWIVGLTGDVPATIDASTSIGSALFDLSGLKIEDFHLETGASSVVLKFNQPNPVAMHELKVETGVGKFRAEGLGNANAASIYIEGGLGHSELDFSGALPASTKAKVEVGVGSVHITVPAGVGVTLHCEDSWVSSVSALGFTQTHDGEYRTENADVAPQKLDLTVEVGMGKVRITRK